MPSLPAHPSLENLKKQAKTLARAWKAGQPEALARIRASHPQYGALSAEQLRQTEPRLTDCQLVLAREAGFDSWPQLRVAVQAAHQESANQLVELACLCHDDPHYDHRSFHARAHEMLRQNPRLAEASIWSAAAAGNVAAVRGFLERESDLVSRPGLLAGCPSSAPVTREWLRSTTRIPPSKWRSFCSSAARIPTRTP